MLTLPTEEKLGTIGIKEIIKKSINELSLSQLYAEIFSSNKSTIQLFEKAGFNMNRSKKLIRKQKLMRMSCFINLSIHNFNILENSLIHHNVENLTLFSFILLI